MGHGIFPNYGLQYQKTIFPLLTKQEKKSVFFPERKKKLTGRAALKNIEEDEQPSKNKKR